MTTIRTTTSAIAFAAVLAVGSVFALPAKSGFAAPMDTASQSDHATLTALSQEMASLRQTVTDQQKQIQADHMAISRLQARVATNTLTSDAAPTETLANAGYNVGPFTVVGNDVYLTGYNLHIQSGSGRPTARSTASGT